MDGDEGLGEDKGIDAWKIGVDNEDSYAFEENKARYGNLYSRESRSLEIYWQPLAAKHLNG